jgi:hypothetical protein
MDEEVVEMYQGLSAENKQAVIDRIETLIASQSSCR